MNHSICKEPDCDRAVGRHGARGWCARHYEIWRRGNRDQVNPRQQSRPIDPEQRLMEGGWTVTESGCWEWGGTITTGGYGYIYIGKGLSSKAHRAAYEAWVEPIPPKHVICHYCDNPPCINPAHLFVGTTRDNVQDAIAKGRFKPRGITMYTPPPPHPVGKRRYILPAESVAFIKERHAAHIDSRRVAGGSPATAPNVWQILSTIVYQ